MKTVKGIEIAPERYMLMSEKRSWCHVPGPWGLTINVALVSTVTKGDRVFMLMVQYMRCVI